MTILIQDLTIMQRSKFEKKEKKAVQNPRQNHTFSSKFAFKIIKLFFVPKIILIYIRFEISTKIFAHVSLYFHPAFTYPSLLLLHRSRTKLSLADCRTCSVQAHARASTTSTRRAKVSVNSLTTVKVSLIYAVNQTSVPASAPSPTSSSAWTLRARSKTRSQNFTVQNRYQPSRRHAAAAPAS